MLVRVVLVAAMGMASLTHRAKQHDQHALVRHSGITQIDSVIVSPAIVRRTIPATFFGINYTAFWEPAERSRASAQALAQTPIRVVRFPGGSPADWYDWQDPYANKDSTTSPMQMWQWARSFGVKRLVLGTNYQGHARNPPGKRYAVNSPENAAAWVRYNRTHGISADMEIGNEEDQSILKSRDDPRYAAYIAIFNKQANAIHHVNRHVRVLGPVGTGTWYWWTNDGLGMFLHGAGNRTGTGQVDGVSLHYYNGSNWNDSMSIAQEWLSVHGPWSAIQTMVRTNDTRRLPVYLTEWNLGNSDFHNAFTPTLGHALAVTDVIGAFAQSGVAGQDYFTIHRSDGWGIFYGTNDARPVDTPMPTYYALALWKHMGNRVVALQQSDDAAHVMSSYATSRKDGSVQVLVINKRSLAHTVRVALQGADPSGHRLRVYSLTGVTDRVEDRDARYDGVTMPSPQYRLPGPRNAGIVRGQTVSYKVPGYSALILDLDRPSPAPTVHWKRLPPPVVAPPLSISATGNVKHGIMNAGETATLQASVHSNEDVGSVLVDLEVYDGHGAKVFQGTHSAYLKANVPVVTTQHYMIPRSARSGQYTLKIGVFGPNWVPLFSWNNDAGHFTVAGTVSPVSSSSVNQ